VKRCVRMIGSLAAAAAVMVLLAACSGGPAHSSATSRSPVSPPAGPTADQSTQSAPPVDRPLDVRGVAACGVLSSDQLRSLNLASDTASDTSNANASGCRWKSGDGSFDVNVVLSSTRDLELFYSIRDTFPVFEPQQVDEYPAVRASAAESGSCLILVGNASDQSFSAQAGTLGGERQDWCSVAGRVASIVLTSLPPRR
jgi:hypothetical protein